jgi:hypothetical protein
MAANSFIEIWKWPPSHTGKSRHALVRLPVLLDFTKILALQPQIPRRSPPFSAAADARSHLIGVWFAFRGDLRPAFAAR